MATVNISKRQLELLKAVVEVMKADIDFTKVSEISGFKTAKYARDSWAILRNKLIGDVATNSSKGDGGGDAPEKKKSTRKRKAGGSDDAETPSKKKTKSKAATQDEEDEDTEAKVKDEPNEAGELMDEMV